jgi:hypothetical protein
VRLFLERGQEPGDGSLAVRLVVLNDTSEPARFDRRLLIGPNPVGARMMPKSREPGFEEEADNFVVLNPWCLYGRERRFGLAGGPLTFHGYLLGRPESRLLPQGPADPAAAALVAEPLMVEP